MVEKEKGKKALGGGKHPGKKTPRERKRYENEVRAGEKSVQKSSTSLEGVSRWGAMKSGRESARLENKPPCANTPSVTFGV